MAGKTTWISLLDGGGGSQDEGTNQWRRCRHRGGETGTGHRDRSQGEVTGRGHKDSLTERVPKRDHRERSQREVTERSHPEIAARGHRERARSHLHALARLLRKPRHRGQHLRAQQHRHRRQQRRQLTQPRFQRQQLRRSCCRRRATRVAAVPAAAASNVQQLRERGRSRATDHVLDVRYRSGRVYIAAGIRAGSPFGCQPAVATCASVKSVRACEGWPHCASFLKRARDTGEQRPTSACTSSATQV
eukprot:203046-Chlamydomonas_euryale.AAC.2